jgi:hypothetical protein
MFGARALAVLLKRNEFSGGQPVDLVFGEYK